MGVQKKKVQSIQHIQILYVIFPSFTSETITNKSLPFATQCLAQLSEYRIQDVTTWNTTPSRDEFDEVNLLVERATLRRMKKMKRRQQKLDQALAVVRTNNSSNL